MTAMDILEALGQTGEELLYSCEEPMGEEHEDAGSSDTEKNGEKHVRRRERAHRHFFLKTAGHRHMAAGMIAAAVLLLVCVAGGGYIRRSFGTGRSNSTSSFSMQESDAITADTAEEETTVEEAETESVSGEDTKTATTESTAETEKSTAVTEETETAESAADKESEEGALTESAALPALRLAEVYIPGFDTSSLSEEEYAEMTELVKLVQEEIDAALSVESLETLPVYRFAGQDDVSETSEEEAGQAGAASGEESAENGMTYSGADDAVHASLIEKLGDYPVITQEEAEEFLRQGYYLSSADLSAEDADSAETVSVELRYLASAETLIYMPYYQFTVVVEEDMVYVCCVPAVSREYLTGTLSYGAAE
ncbi:MAG: hypothetical protein LUE16_10880 [Lachnospiraceae bacterium]|nr:hypothetical protein [Lachnospiraceae bacterium]